MRIDAHHSFSERYPLGHLKTILARNRFETSIAVAGEPVEGQWHVVRADLGAAAAGLAVERARGNAQCVGICHALAGDVPPGIHEVARHGLALDLELGPAQLPLVSRIAEQYPALRIAIDHLARPSATGPLDEWARDLARAAGHPNVCCKLSGYPALKMRAAVRHALAVFGARRLMFGSDWPAGLPEVTWKQTLAAFTQAIGAQSIETREELLGGTAQRFYGLEL